MKKVYNKKAVSYFCNKIRMCNVNCEPEDIYNKTIWKKLDLNKIENIGIVFSYADNQKALMQKFFPNKYEEISNRGEFGITQFIYSNHDNKIHCVVVQDGNERHLKLSTDNYSDRIPDEITNAQKKLKKEIDSFYGYWFDGNKSNWYITDRNKHGKEYRKILLGANNTVTNYYYSTHWCGGGYSYDDLMIIL